MKKIFSLVLIAVAAVALLAGCDKFDPIEKDDFIGTRWVAEDNGANYSLVFKKNLMELRTDIKAGGWYIISGDYDFYPDTKRLVLVFNELKEEHNINVQFGEYVLGGAQLTDDNKTLEYEDSRGVQATFTKSN